MGNKRTLELSVNENKRAFSVTEAASYVGVSRGTFHNWLVSGLIPYEELPGRGNGAHRFRRVRKEDLDSFLNKFYHGPKTEKRVTNHRGEIILPTLN